MSNTTQLTKLIFSIEILFVLLAGSIGYVIGSATSSYSVPDSGTTTTIRKEVDELKQLYDQKIKEKMTSFQELEQQKDSIAKLVNLLETSEADTQSLVKYQSQYHNLEEKMKVLVVAINTLHTKKSNLTDKTKQLTPSHYSDATPNAKSTTDANFTANTNKYSKITISNVQSLGYSNQTKQSIPTTVAKKTDFIKVAFTLDENPTAKPEVKNYYVQIINAKNNVIGKHITEFFDDASLTYSFVAQAQYNNKKLEISENLVGDTFEKGVYYVFIFDRNELVGSSTFTLK